ncbi:MAG: NupC/NupG family nucleoside CNT transporter [Hyphomicrobiaceae bacterium]
MVHAAQSLLGVLAIPVLVWICSENRAALTAGQALGTVAAGLALQFAVAVALLRMPWTQPLFDGMGQAVTALERATGQGMQMVFGYLAGAPAPFDVTQPQNAFIFAFRALPMILLLSALARLLYYWGVLQLVVRAFARVLQKAFGIGGALGTATAAEVFLGMIESPLLVRPYLAQMGRGALFAVMVSGMATVAGTVMALYAAILEPIVPGAAGHVLAASLMNAPAALILARLAVPEGFAEGPSEAQMQIGEEPRSSMDAIVQGTLDGLKLLANVAAMLVVMIALVALANGLLAVAAGPFGASLTLQMLLGWLCAPFAWLIGIPWTEAATAGALIGEKLVLNELLAYFDLARLPPDALSPRSRTILTYALCGFANLGSLGILIGGLTAMVPERRHDIVALAPKAVLVGTLATLHSAAVVGTLLWR